MLISCFGDFQLFSGGNDMPVLKKCEIETDFQKELSLIDQIDNIIFGDLSRKDVVNYYAIKKQIKGIMRKYQTLVMRQDKFQEIIAMQEFDKYRGLETERIH